MTDDAPRPTCPACHQPRPSWALCDRCHDRTMARLAELVELQALACSIAALTPSQTGDPGPIGAHRDPPLPVDLHALDIALAEGLLRGLEADQMGLEDWAVDWRHWLGHSPHGMATEHDTGPAATLARVVGYLRANLPRCGRPAADGGHPAIDEFVADVRSIHTHAIHALRLAEPAPWTFPCPGDALDGGLCGNRLRVDHDGRHLAIHCRRCGTTWSLERLLLVARAAGSAIWVDADTAQTHLGVSRATLYRMADRGDIGRRYGRFDIGATRQPLSNA